MNIYDVVFLSWILFRDSPISVVPQIPSFLILWRFVTLIIAFTFLRHPTSFPVPSSLHVSPLNTAVLVLPLSCTCPFFCHTRLQILSPSSGVYSNSVINKLKYDYSSSKQTNNEEASMQP